MRKPRTIAQSPVRLVHSLDRVVGGGGLKQHVDNPGQTPMHVDNPGQTPLKDGLIRL